MEPNPSHATANRHTILRVIAGALAVIALPSATRDLYGLARGGFDPLLAVFGACTTLFVAGCVWFALRGHLAASRAHMWIALRSGLVVGAVGFAIGFLGPLVWAPGANQGPLLGIFITGPIGFVAGCVIGWLVARAHTPATAAPPPPRVAARSR